MMQASPSTAAAQALDAARRAEAEGRLEYAVQVYRLVSDQHHDAPEAVTAREALARIVPQRISTAAARVSPPAPRSTSSARRHPPAQPDTPQQRPEARRTGPMKIAPVAATEGRRPLILPRTAPGYVFGRAIAYVVMAAGAVLAVAGIGLTILHVIGPGPWMAWPLWQGAIALPYAGPLAIAIALGLVLLGQLAQALFDNAAAAQALIAIERAKADHSNSQGWR